VSSSEADGPPPFAHLAPGGFPSCDPIHIFAKGARWPPFRFGTLLCRPFPTSPLLVARAPSCPAGQDFLFGLAGCFCPLSTTIFFQSKSTSPLSRWRFRAICASRPTFLSPGKIHLGNDAANKRGFFVYSISLPSLFPIATRLALERVLGLSLRHLFFSLRQYTTLSFPPRC